ncbi:hypothetical protein BP00DRAFT_52574 [Aspergillus indologenus CBS 114.80]|uniref:Uncharacterized protein n=1 Tax=Aspergillus indologenus CBS 114.80 TaxID=1450541 RepID=A0A2V5HS50_9EURO|nr:hypothetical protein BP00DRAFT_52574 [Aspergillus indologenus CBS 114.80]
MPCHATNVISVRTCHAVTGGDRIHLHCKIAIPTLELSRRGKGRGEEDAEAPSAICNLLVYHLIPSPRNTHNHNTHQHIFDPHPLTNETLSRPTAPTKTTHSSSKINPPSPSNPKEGKPKVPSSPGPSTPIRIDGPWQKGAVQRGGTHPRRYATFGFGFWTPH